MTEKRPFQIIMHPSLHTEEIAFPDILVKLSPGFLGFSRPLKNFHTGITNQDFYNLNISSTSGFLYRETLSKIVSGILDF